MPISLPLPRFDWGGVRWGGGIASNRLARTPSNKKDALGRLFICIDMSHVNVKDVVYFENTHIRNGSSKFGVCHILKYDKFPYLGRMAISLFYFPQSNLHLYL